MEKIKKAVGLIVLTNTKNKGLVAALQVRGDFNVEKNTSETYKGATQLTVHGSINEGESEIDALLRETKEELGEEFAGIIEENYGKLVKLNEMENKNMSVVNFNIIVSEQDLGKIRTDEKTGAKIRLVSKDEISNIRELKPEDRLSGITNENEIAMFKDNIEAVRLASEKFDR